MPRPPLHRSARLQPAGAARVILVLAGACAPEQTSTRITDVTVVDGTGSPGRVADVRIEGERIQAVGDLAPRPTDRVIDGGGLVLSPGFINTHSHHDRGLFEEPTALAAVSQGITTIVVGQDGGSRFPLAAFFDSLAQSPPAVNVASYSGHNTLRRRTLPGDDRRQATPAEIETMAGLLREDLRAGALGLSTGLEYDPGIYSTADEVLALARVTAGAGGRYMSHLRSEDRALFAAVDEIIGIGRATGMPVQISHVKLAMRSLRGRADELLARLDAARDAGVDVTADVYPYEYWQSTMTVLFPDRDFTNRETAAFALTELTSPRGMRIGRFDPDPTYVGLTLAEIAERRGTDPVSTYLDLIQESRALARETRGGTESIIATSMDSADVATLIRWPHATIGSDGALRGRHPRGYGAFPRALGRHVRNGSPLTLEAAVHKMTQLAAKHVGLPERGVVRDGAPADLVLSDPARIVDRATPEEPHRTASGIHTVWVNGVAAYAGGTTTGRRPGLGLRRPSGGS